MVSTPARLETKNLLIELPKTISLFVTLEQFIALATANRGLRLERNAQGELVVNPPSGWETGKRNGHIFGQLYIWWLNAGEPGEVFESSTGFKLPNGAIRSPDASWVSEQRWDKLNAEQKQSFANICPDFVVELRSSSDTLKTLQEKMIEYRENGAKLGWLINPQKNQVEIYRQGSKVEILDNPRELSGEEVLPEFVLNLRKILS